MRPEMVIAIPNGKLKVKFEVQVDFQMSRARRLKKDL